MIAPATAVMLHIEIRLQNGCGQENGYNNRSTLNLTPLSPLPSKVHYAVGEQHSSPYSVFPDLHLHVSASELMERENEMSNMHFECGGQSV